MCSLLAFFAPGPFEIVVICIVAVLLFGSQLPRVARSLGQAIPSFKKGFIEMNNEIEDIGDEIVK